MKKGIINIGLVGVSLLFFSGCATVFAPEHGDSINFSSNIDGVSVAVNGKSVGTIEGGNFNYDMPRGEKGKKTVTFSKPGYKDSEVVVSRKLAMSFWANILGSYFSTTSSTVDIQNGNAYEHTPNQFHVNMREKEE